MSKKGIVILTVIIVYILSIVIGNKIRNHNIDRQNHVIKVDSYSKDLSVSYDSLTIDWEKSKVYINGYVAYYDKELELKVKYYNLKNNRNVNSDELKDEFEKFLESDASESDILDDFHDTIKGNFSTDDCNHDLDKVTFEDFEDKVEDKLLELYGINHYDDATEEQINEAIDSITNWEDDDSEFFENITNTGNKEYDHINEKLEKKYEESTTEE